MPTDPAAPAPRIDYEGAWKEIEAYIASPRWGMNLPIIDAAYVRGVAQHHTCVETPAPRATLEADLAAARADNHELLDAAWHANHALAERDAAIDERIRQAVTEENARWRTRMFSFILDRDNRLDECDATIAGLHLTIAVQDAHAARQDAAITEAVGEWLAAEAQAVSMRHEIESLDALVEKRDRTIANLEARVAKEGDYVIRLQTALASASARARDVEALHRAAKAVVAALSQRVVELDGAVADALLDPHAMATLARVLKEGLAKHPDPDEWRGVSEADHLGRAHDHIHEREIEIRYNLAPRKDHTAHAFAHLMFAVGVQEQDVPPDDAAPVQPSTPSEWAKWGEWNPAPPDDAALRRLIRDELYEALIPQPGATWFAVMEAFAGRVERERAGAKGDGE